MHSAGVLDVTPRQAIEPWESKLGLSSREVAAALDTDQRSLSRWVSGRSYPQVQARRKLAELHQLSVRLLDLFVDAAAARCWLNTESRYLGSMTPADAIRAGRIDRAEAALEAMESGVFI